MEKFIIKTEIINKWYQSYLATQSVVFVCNWILHWELNYWCLTWRCFKLCIISSFNIYTKLREANFTENIITGKFHNEFYEVFVNLCYYQMSTFKVQTSFKYEFECNDCFLKSFGILIPLTGLLLNCI